MNRERKFSVGSLTVDLIEGDIAQVEAEALITAINSGGLWFGGIDGVIQRAAGQTFHAQAAVVPLKHGTTVVARKNGDHRGRFSDVVFVVDDLEGPLHEIVAAALTAADRAGYRTVSLPAIRTGVMLGTVEKDAPAATREIVLGIETFASTLPSHLESLTLVVYDQREIFDCLAYDLERVRH